MIVKTRALCDEEAQRYVGVLRDAEGSELIYAAVCAVCIGIGARIGEVLTLRNADVLTPAGEVREKIRRKVEKKRKTFYQEAVFCDPVLRSIVQRYAASERRLSRWMSPDALFFTARWDGPAITYRAAWGHNRALMRRAGIDPRGVAFHGQRKTFLTAVFRQVHRDTGDMFTALRTVQRMAGHKSVDTTLAYLDIQEVDEGAAVGAALAGITAGGGAR